MQRKRKGSRRGAAAVECAVIAPLLLLIAFGTIEACSMIFLRQSLEIAAYEGARVAIVPGMTDKSVTATCQTIANVRGVRGATVTINPTNISGQPYGTFINVMVTAPCASNAFFPPWFYAGRIVQGDAQMMKEM